MSDSFFKGSPNFAQMKAVLINHQKPTLKLYEMASVAATLILQPIETGYQHETSILIEAVTLYCMVKLVFFASQPYL